MAALTPAIVRELRRVLDEASIPDAVAGVYLADETEARGCRLQSIPSQTVRGLRSICVAATNHRMLGGHR
jgi:hypothetical protein